MKKIYAPVNEAEISQLRIGDSISISGYIYTGRDAALPKLVKLIESNELVTRGIELKGSLIFHSAVSPAGVGPTSSNKVEIESNIPALSKAGVKIHLGKGKLSKETIEKLNKNNSIFATIPPVTALLSSRIISKEIVAFSEEGMEALHRLKVKDFPAVVTIAHGESLF